MMGLRIFNRRTDNRGTVARGQLIAWTHDRGRLNRVSRNRAWQPDDRPDRVTCYSCPGSGLDVTYTIALGKFGR